MNNALNLKDEKNCFNGLKPSTPSGSSRLELCQHSQKCSESLKRARAQDESVSVLISSRI